MHILILGGAGMLGHKLAQRLRTRFTLTVTVRGDAARYARYASLFDGVRLLDEVDAAHFDGLTTLIRRARPQAVVNCVGVVKQRPEAKDPLASITLNALLPHHLERLCAGQDARLIHISTDCVFSGQRGLYTEDDLPDPPDLYGRSKLLGEVTDSPHALTLRTSIIGRELASKQGLIEWFLSNRGNPDGVKGFRRAVFSGLTTLALADLIADLLADHPDLNGLYHVAAAPINKDDLLRRVNTAYDAGIAITPDDAFAIDRSLDAARLRDAIGYTAPTWEAMLAQMAADPTPYETYHQERGA